MSLHTKRGILGEYPKYVTMFQVLLTTWKWSSGFLQNKILCFELFGEMYVSICEI